MNALIIIGLILLGASTIAGWINAIKNDKVTKTGMLFNSHFLTSKWAWLFFILGIICILLGAHQADLALQ